MAEEKGDIQPDHVRLTALDGIRGMAVLMVMFFHFFQREDFRDFRIGRLLTFASHLGIFGVDLFFVLSGFLITGILLHSKKSPHYFRNFYARRSLRIFPLAFGALAVYYFVIPAFHFQNWTPWRQQIWYWLYLGNIPATFWVGQVNGPWHFWSLAVEEHFYLVWPAVVLLCGRRGLYRACLVCLVISFLTRFGLDRREIACWFPFTLARLDGLAIGAMLAVFVRGTAGFSRLNRLKPHLLFVGIVVLVIPCWVMLTGKRAAMSQDFKFFIAALMFGSLVAASLNPIRPGVGRFFSNRVLTTFGQYSYGLYVWDGIIHFFISPFTSRAAISAHVHGNLFVLAATMLTQLVLVFIVAFISWHLYEKQFLKLKSLFAYDPSDAKPIGVAAAPQPVPAG